jgi:hypothetical protein
VDANHENFGNAMKNTVYRCETVTKAEIWRHGKVVIEVVPLLELYIDPCDVSLFLREQTIPGEVADHEGIQTPVQVTWLSNGRGLAVVHRNKADHEICTFFNFGTFPFAGVLRALCVDEIANAAQKKASAQDVQTSSDQT